MFFICFCFVFTTPISSAFFLFVLAMSKDERVEIISKKNQTRIRISTPANELETDVLSQLAAGIYRFYRKYHPGPVPLVL